jgi:hypothetical protein
LGDQIKVAEMGWACFIYRGRKRPLGRPRHGWENIIMDIREVRWDKWQAVVNMVMNHWLA